MVRAMNLSGSVSGFKPAPLPGVVPAPLEVVELNHPSLPAGLDGLTVLHLTDLHLRAGKPWSAWLDRLAGVLGGLEVDLAVFTGDAMNYPGDEDSAIEGTAKLLNACRTRLGIFGIFGNHDSPAFRDRAVREITSARWLRDEVVAVGGLPLRLVGPEDPEDLLHTLLDGVETGASRGSDGAFEIGLVHYPTEVYPAAEFGIPLVLAGHTHGGQIRVSADFAPHTSSDLPGGLASGVMRYRDTLVCVPRGLGEAVVEMRVNCTRQAPVYVLRRGPLLGGVSPSEAPRLHRVIRW